MITHTNTLKFSVSTLYMVICAGQLLMRSMEDIPYLNWEIWGSSSCVESVNLLNASTTSLAGIKARASIILKWRVNSWSLLYCTSRPSDWVFFSMFEHRWKKQPLMSAFGKIAETQLFEANSKSQRIVFGSFLAASTWFRISENNLSYVILVFLGNKPKIQGIVLLLILAWMVYNWKNICGQTLKVPSQYHSPKFARSWTAWSVPAIKIRSSSSWPLSKSKHNFQFSNS